MVKAFEKWEYYAMIVNFIPVSDISGSIVV